MNPATPFVSRLVAAALAFVALAFLTTAPLAFSEATDLTADQALTLLEQDKLVLVDVRTPQEWRQTGIAKGAEPISMLDPQFLVAIMQIQMANPGKPLAFICRTGRRSGVVQAELVKRGFDNVFSVYGGMSGNGQVAGWTAKGLPVTACLTTNTACLSCEHCPQN